MEEYLEGTAELLRVQQSMAEATVWAWYTECIDMLLCLFAILAALFTARLIINLGRHAWKVYKYRSRVNANSKRLS